MQEGAVLLSRFFPRRLKILLHQRLKSRGHVSFLVGLKSHPHLLDVGCGNSSPLRYKYLRPDMFYIGLDVENYNQSDLSLASADRYQVVGTEEFAAAIEAMEGQMDAVISSHNIEHTLEPQRVLRAMGRALKPGGRMYLSFPTEASVGFPSRAGTLNFHDDATHVNMPVFSEVCRTLRDLELEIEYADPRYRPVVLAAIGFLLEPVSRLLGRMIPFGATWAYYGFESILWVRKPPR
jgi:SAM-dependent methyltransferase